MYPIYLQQLLELEGLEENSEICICNGCRVDSVDIVCDAEDCTRQFHKTCLGIDDTRSILQFYCQTCENSGDPRYVTQWKTHGKLSRPLKDLSYDVESVEGCGWDDIDLFRSGQTPRKFLINWAPKRTKNGRMINYLPTWEPEENLAGCFNLLQKFCRSAQLPLSTIRAKAGASGSYIFNTENWVDIEEILRVVRMNQTSTRYNSHAEVTQLEENFGDKDQIYIYVYLDHFFVIAFRPSERFAYVADGMNEFSNNYQVRSDFYLQFQRKFRSIRFEQQTAVDFCGSSAALIALEMRNLFKAFDFENWPKLITVPTGLRKRIVKQLHKPRISQTIATFKSGSDYRKRHYCKHGCVKAFSSKRSLNAHQINCSKI